MATQNVQDVTSAGDRLKLALAIAIVLAGVAAYYVMAQQPMVLRILALVGGLVAGATYAGLFGRDEAAPLETATQG